MDTGNVGCPSRTFCDRMKTGDGSVQLGRDVLWRLGWLILRGGQSAPGLFDDFRRGSGVSALGELGCGEEFGVAGGAVARAQEVKQALFADGDGCRGRWVWWRSNVCGSGGRRPSGFFGSLGSLRMMAVVGVSGGGLRLRDRAAMSGRRFERPHGDLQAVDHLAGAAGVDGVLGEAVDDCGEGDEDGGTILDGRDFHAGDFRVDEDTALVALGVLEVVVIAVVFAFERGRAAALSAGGLVEVALVVEVEVFEWCRHGVPPWVSICA